MPKSLLRSFGPALRERMGADAWEQRLQTERRLNPASGWTLLQQLHRAIHLGAKGLIGIALRLAGKYAVAQANCRATELHHHSLELPSLKPSQRLRILHLSDFHLDTRVEQASLWAEQIRELEADLCVITGDFLNAFQLPSTETLDALQGLFHAIPIPTFGILGNHDCMLMVPYLEAMGVQLLLNETRTLQVENLTVEITGLDDPHLFQSDDLTHALKTRNPVPAPDLRVLLVHAPKEPATYAAEGFDLCLCGHTHGGQLCTRSGTPLLRNGRYRSDRIAGRWQLDGMAGYTSRGTGTGRLTYRLNCPPEITLHHVRGCSSS